MKYTAKQYAEALYDSVQTTASKDHDTVLNNFVKVLAANNDLRLYDKIAEEFHKMELAAKGQTLATVTSAKPLDAKSEKTIIHQLNDYINGKVELKKKVDENLIGGVVIQMDDVVIDASVKKNLEDLKNNLTQ